MTKKVLFIAFILCLPLFLTLLSYKITVRFADITAEQQEVLSFLEGKEDLSPRFTPAERSHLEDVKKVMNSLDFLFYLFLLILTLIIVHHEKDIKKITALFRWSGIVTVVGVGVLVILFYVHFDAVFVMFHTLFFPQGNWMFPAESLLIQTFPYLFFMSLGRMIVIQTLVWGIIFILLSLFLRHARQN